MKVISKLLKKKFKIVNYFNLKNNLKYNNLNLYINHVFFKRQRVIKLHSNYTDFIIDQLSIKRKKLNLRTFRNKYINIRYRQVVYLNWYRKNLKYFFNIQRRVKVLTKFCLKFKKHTYSIFKLMRKFELRLINVILRSKIVTLFSDAQYLILNGFICVNNSVTYDINYILKKGDKLNILFNKKHHINYREQFSSVITKYYRMWPYLYIISENNKYPARTKSNLTAKWLVKTIWTESDIPKYLEIDFITMSLIIVYEPSTILDILPYYYSHFKLFGLRLYNWRFRF